MKIKIFLMVILTQLLFCACYSQQQDSIRTKNDKPGTPQSLRTPDSSPRSHVKITNNNVAPLQTINHGGTESNHVNNTKTQTIIPDAHTDNGVPIPQSQPPVVNKLPSTTDTLSSGGKSNVTSPIRK